MNKRGSHMFMDINEVMKEDASSESELDDSQDDMVY
jgi:hypothetical protein